MRWDGRSALSTIGNVMPAPPLPFLPRGVHGPLVILASMAFAGEDAAADRALAPYRPTAVSRTMFVDSIDIEAARTILEHLSASDAPMRAAQLRALGGAMARVPADATAFAHRSKPMLLNVAAFYQQEATREAHRAWVSTFSRALQPNDDGAYVGFLTDDRAARIRATYAGTTWERLSRIKATYDPANVFRLNQNVTPARR